MFKHILIPVDGSKRSLKGAKAGARLARALGARVTGVYVIAPYTPAMYGEAAIYVPGLSVREYTQQAMRTARKALAAIEAQARGAGVKYASKVVQQALPWEGILRAARGGKCDAVVMASHGRGGLGGLILGSETQRVLAHSKIPVFVIR